MSFDDRYPPQSPWSTGLSGRCPRCGQGHMFEGFLDLRPPCEIYGLDYAFPDAGDGPAVFVTLIGGCLLLGMALFVQLKFSPPVWLLMLIFAPITLVVKVPNVVVVNPKLPVKSMVDLLAYAKANPGKVSYGSSGIGNPQHLAGEWRCPGVC